MTYFPFAFIICLFPMCLSWNLEFDKKRNEPQLVVFTDNNSFDFHNRLYLEEDNTNILCQIINPQNDTGYNRNELVKYYISLGMAPTIVFSNSTWSTHIMEFLPLVEGQNYYWQLNVSKTVFSQNWQTISLLNYEPLDFTVELGTGLDLLKTKGSLVIKENEPLLSVQLGDELPGLSTAFNPLKLTLWHSHCSPNVAVLHPTFNMTLQPYSGCYLGITKAAFAFATTKWFNLLHLSAAFPDQYSICKEATFSSCETIEILDFVVPDNHILVLTSKGIIRSEDIASKAKTFPNSKVRFYLVSSIPPAIETSFKTGSLTRDDIKFHFIQDCFCGKSIRNSTVYLVFRFREGDSEGSMVLAATKPFEDWNEINLEQTNIKDTENFVVHAIADDFERQHVLVLMMNIKESKSILAVFEDTLNNLLYPMYKFPSSGLTDLHLDNYQNSIYVYGAEVWFSDDGGSSFHKIQQLFLNDVVVSFGATYTGEAIFFTSKHGSLYYGKSGRSRVMKIWDSLNTPSAIGSDQQGIIYKVSVVNESKFLSFKSEKVDTNLKASILQYSRPLLIQQITERHVRFYTYCEDSLFSDSVPCSDAFSISNVGLVLKSRHGGEALITGISTANKSRPFGQQIDTIVILPFLEDKSNITQGLKSFELKLEWHDHLSKVLLLLEGKDNQYGWLGSDVGKTVVLLDGSCYIISEFVNATAVFAESLIPRERKDAIHEVHEGGFWTIYDFRPFDAIKGSLSQVLNITSPIGNESKVYISDGGFKFLDSHEGMLLKIQSFLGSIRTVISASTVLVNLELQNHSVQGSYTDGWGLVRIKENQNITTAPALFEIWWLEEQKCQSCLLGGYKFQKLSHYLDARDKLYLSVKATKKGISLNGGPLLTASLGTPQVFDTDTRYTSSELNQTLHLSLRQRPLVSGLSLVTVRLRDLSLFCAFTTLRIAIYSFCPPSKKLKFSYPLNFSRIKSGSQNLVDNKNIIRSFRLPINYRPPSSRGVAIPTSSNIYNAHPEKPPYRDAYKITRINLRYKQCSEKKDRKSCQCSPEMEVSTQVIHSDCITTVYRLLYGETLKPTFDIWQEGKSEKLAFPYYLTELNQRKDFGIIHDSQHVETNFENMFLEPTQNSSIEFKGSGLFHFRAHVVQKEYTFCSLTDEFLVYIDDTPLAHPIQDIVRTCTGMAFACLLYLVYMWKFYGKNKMKNE